MRRVLFALFLLDWAACAGSGSSTDDAAPASDARPILDASVVRDSLARLSWVEFAMTGCASPDVTTGGDPDAGPDPGPRGDVVDASPDDSDGGDGGPDSMVQPCAGQAPLALRFTAVAPVRIEAYLWMFGDGEASTEPSPVHVFAEPGIYDVSLTAAAAGSTATAVRPAAIEVGSAGLGWACSRDSQCGAGGECICAADAPCPASLAGGMCAQPCGPGQPCAEGVCADLAPGFPSGAGEQDWQRALCVAACTDDSQCPTGLRCQELASASPAGWITGCLAPGVLRPLGASCKSASGALDHSACASGLCADLGARGVCAQACTPGSCPGSAACAHFAAGPALCVARCAGADACTSDPWLGCEPAGGAGSWSFAVDEPGAPEGYCAPRACMLSAECGLDGRCAGGFCES